MVEIAEVLLANLDAAYARRGWHGPTLRGALRGLTVPKLLWRPAAKRHNIWELALHCAYWKYAVRRRLLGLKRGSFPLKGSNWFPAQAPATDGQWQEAMRLLEEQHESLRQAIEGLPAAALTDRRKLRLIYGVAAHDLYHAGQIQLIKRLYAN